MSAEHPFAYIEDGKVYLKPFLDYAARELGEVKESEEASYAYFEEKFAPFKTKIEKIKADVEASENKGSFLMKIVHLKEQLGTVACIGDFEALHTTLVQLEELIKEGIEENRKRNLEVKKVIIEELKVIVDRQTWEQDKDEIKSIQQRWIRIGRVPDQEQEAIEEAYRSLVSDFFEGLKERNEAKKEVYELRVAKYQKLIDRANDLMKDVTPEQAEVFKSLQGEWKEVGYVPKPLLGDLWDQFKKLGNDFFEQLMANRKKASQKAKVNPEEVLSRKEALLAKAEALATLKTLDGLQKSLDGLKIDWKKSGKLSNQKGKELQAKFYDACNYVGEYLFIVKRTERFVKNFDKLDTKDKNKALISTLRKSISKDKEEVAVYEDNAMNINLSASQAFEKMVDSTLDNKKRMLEIKQRLLANLNK